jgi:predicted TIM-barrel fold metal-dependent hydrolase
MEDHHVLVHSMQNQAASLILEGVFEAFPRLKVVLIEGGFAWGPTLAWRLDNHWRKMRDEVPHLKRPPSDYMRSNLWFATQPVEEPENPEDLHQVFEWIGWDRIVSSSDYPHWDYDEPSRVLPAGVSKDNRDAFFLGNARKVFGIAA